MMLTQARLKELLHYDPLTGWFRWLVNRTGGVKAGDIAGTLVNGYIRISIDGVKYAAHRLAFLFMEGAFPADNVDHHYEPKTDNRWTNIRPATRSQNAMNSKTPTDNTSGVKGVHYRAKTRKWRVRISVDGKVVNLGSFGTLTYAAKVRRAAERRYYGEFARAA
jgi:hypothetical protein